MALGLCLRKMLFRQVKLSSIIRSRTSKITYRTPPKLHLIMKSFTLAGMAGMATLAVAQTPSGDMPEPAGTELSAEPITVTDSFDGGNFLYDRDCKCSVPPYTNVVDADLEV